MTQNTSATFWRVARNHLQSVRWYRSILKGAHPTVRRVRLSRGELNMCADHVAGWYRSAMQYRELARSLQREGR